VEQFQNHLEYVCVIHKGRGDSSLGTLCGKFGTEEETSVHIRSLRHKYLGSFFYPEDIRKLIIGAIWNFTKGTGLLYLSIEHGAQRACFKA